jgi:hypothetical protein
MRTDENIGPCLRTDADAQDREVILRPRVRIWSGRQQSGHLNANMRPPRCQLLGPALVGPRDDLAVEGRLANIVAIVQVHLGAVVVSSDYADHGDFGWMNPASAAGVPAQAVLPPNQLPGSRLDPAAPARIDPKASCRADGGDDAEPFAYRHKPRCAFPGFAAVLSWIDGHSCPYENGSGREQQPNTKVSAGAPLEMHRIE